MGSTDTTRQRTTRVRAIAKATTTADDGKRPWTSMSFVSVLLAALAAVADAYVTGTLDAHTIAEAILAVSAAWGFRRRL